MGTTDSPMAVGTVYAAPAQLATVTGPWTSLIGVAPERGRPSASLAPRVSAVRRGMVRLDNPLVSRILPNSDINIVVNLGDPVRCQIGPACSGGSLSARTRAATMTIPTGEAVVIGGLGEAVTVAFGRRVCLLSAAIRPGLVRAFFDQPADTFTGGIVPLHDLGARGGAAWCYGDVADEADRLTRATSSAGSAADARVRIALRTVGRILRTRHATFANGTGTRGIEAAHSMMQCIERSGGRVRVTDLEARSGYTRQHIGRLFREHVGMAPKLACRLARLHSVLGSLGARDTVDAARLAIRSGFSDQSHMINEFRRLTGLTPSAARVPFLQDTAADPPEN